MDVLIHISHQLSNSTTPAFEPAAFQVPFNVAAVNTLFFLSLALVLIDAFLAMLVKGWLQEFDRGWRTYTVAHLRAQERERRLQALERWRLPELVALLPILIQGSLFLFCIGLLVLIFPLHLPSAILCSLFFVFVVGFYGLTTYVSIVNNYAPFSSPVSRLLARGLAMLQTPHIPIPQIARRIAHAISLHNRPPVSQGRQAGADAPDKTTQRLPSNNGTAPMAQPHDPNSAEKSNMVPRSRSGIDPQTHAHVLERLVTTTAEAVENIPIFLELLDQPVKDHTIQPFSVEKWKGLIHITFRLLRDQSAFPVSAAWTLARAMILCYDRKTVDDQLCFELQHRLGTKRTHEQKSRLPLRVLFSSYLRFWLDAMGPNNILSSDDLWKTIAFLDPSDVADAELLWMVNTSHRAISLSPSFDRFDKYLQFCIAVLTYIASTEQSRRSKVPLTAAVIYALGTIGPAIERERESELGLDFSGPAIDNGGINPIDRLGILPGIISTEPVSMTFCGVDALNLWSEECIQRVKDLLQWNPSSGRYLLNGFRLSLIAALHVGSTKHAHAHSIFADLLKRTSTTDITFRFSDAYDHEKPAIYMYVAVTRKPLKEDGHYFPIFYEVICNTLTLFSELQLPGLHLLEFALKHVHNTQSLESNWLDRSPWGSISMRVGQLSSSDGGTSDHWLLLHLETLLTPKAFLHPKEVGKLEWSDTPVKVHIAKARLSLYDSSPAARYEAAKGPKPDPALLRVFLWSKDREVYTRAFKWSLDLVPISQSGIPGDANSTSMFIPEGMGYESVEHFIHVLCEGSHEDRSESWRFLRSGLVSKWAMLPSSWCRDFASALLFSIVQPLDIRGLPAYQGLAKAHRYMSLYERAAFLPFLATLLNLVKSSLTWVSLNSLENWLADLPAVLEDQDARAKIQNILATKKAQLTLELFATELPMAITVTSP